MITPAIYHNRGMTLYPADTYIDGQVPGTNYSTATQLLMKIASGASFHRYPIMQFSGDLKRFKTLRIFFNVSGGVSTQTVVVDVISNVNINTVLFTTSYTVLNSAIATRNVGTSGGVNIPIDISLSTFLSSFTGNMITFRLRAGLEETGVMRVYSNETPDYKPRLIT